MILIVMLVAGLYAQLHFAMGYHFNDRKFDSALFKSFGKSNNPDNPRGQMFDDLDNRYLRKGLSKKDIEGLLGPADMKSEYDFLSYNLGMWSGFRMDYDSLDLKFDHEGKLLNYHRVQH